MCVRFQLSNSKCLHSMLLEVFDFLSVCVLSVCMNINIYIYINIHIYIFIYKDLQILIHECPHDFPSKKYFIKKIFQKCHVTRVCKEAVAIFLGHFFFLYWFIRPNFTLKVDPDDRLGAQTPIHPSHCEKAYLKHDVSFPTRNSARFGAFPYPFRRDPRVSINSHGIPKKNIKIKEWKINAK